MTCAAPANAASSSASVAWPLRIRNCLNTLSRAVQRLRAGERLVDVEHRRAAPRSAAAPRAPRRTPARGSAPRPARAARRVHDPAADRHQRRLIVLDQRDHVLARDVGRGDHRDRRPVERRIELDRLEHAVRDLRAHRRAVPRARRVEVVEVLRAPGDLRDAVDARHRACPTGGTTTERGRSIPGSNPSARAE